MSADGLADGSMASRASGCSSAVGSASSVAREKNSRSADCNWLSKSAATAASGGTDIRACPGGCDHNSVVRRDTLIDYFRDLIAIRGEFLVYDDGYRHRAHTYE